MSVKNQKGFSLPEIMVALGLMGGISLVTMKLVQESSNNEVILKSKAEIQKTTALIKGVLNDPEACRKMLNQNVVSSIPTNIIKPADVPNLNFDGTPNPNGLYQRLRDNSFKRLLVPDTKYIGFRTGAITIAPPISGTPNVADLVIDFRVERKANMFSDGNDSNDLIISQRIPFIYAGTPSGANTIISDCGPVLSESNETAKQKLCASLGQMAEWDSTLKTCRFQTKKCPFGQAMIKVGSNGDPVCRNIDEMLDANQLIDVTPCQSTSGRYKIGVNGSGKLKINCY